MNKIFFSQTILDSLVTEGRIKLDRNVLTLLTPDKPSFELQPAYRINRTADNSADPHGLVGQIKYEHELRAEQAEVYLDSVIYKDVAYVAEPGYIGEKQELIDSLSDTELLSRFLLDSLF